MQRGKHSAEFKAKIALEAVKGLRTINEIAGEAEVHPTQATLMTGRKLPCREPLCDRMRISSFSMNLLRLWIHRMVVLISHRFSTVRMADKIIVMANGQIIEQGSHEQLLKTQGRYAHLFSLQAAGYQ
jgi:hypothetical protein